MELGDTSLVALKAPINAFKKNKKQNNSTAISLSKNLHLIHDLVLSCFM